MLVLQAMKLTMLALSVMLDARTDAASSASVKLCGRKLSDIMSRICKVYNSPSWDAPTVVEQPPPIARRKRQTGGIADECCTYGCTYEQLSEYCSVSTNTEILGGLEAHLIEDRSAESSASAPPAVVAVRREVGRSRGYGRRRRRRCRCRRPHRHNTATASVMGNMGTAKNAARAAPVVGTVSPLLTWGRTINTDLPRVDRDRYAYIAVYNI